LNNRSVLSFAISGSSIFAGAGGVYLSTNNGTNWLQTGLSSQPVWSLAISGSSIFAGTDGGVYLSTNNGTNWMLTALNNQHILSLAISGSNIYAGTDGNGLYFSTNYGTNWIKTWTILNNQSVSSIVISGSNIFAGTSNGVYLTTNNCGSWAQWNDGFNVTPQVSSLVIGNTYVFAGTIGESVWRRSVSEIGIKQISDNVPEEYKLFQNYPNPFNPTTKIKFDIPSDVRRETSNVKLVVYDILGREVATLVNQPLQPGTYEVDFDGTNYPSGVYFYRITAGNPSTSSGQSFTETKKMVLLK